MPARYAHPMSLREQLIRETALTDSDAHRLTELIAEWQLLSDISFADLVLWVPRRSDERSWPEGHVAIAQIRPMTAATVFAQDLIGTSVQWGERPNVDLALSSGEIVRAADALQLGDFLVREEAIPVHFAGRVIAVISRYRNLETMRTPSRLELNYREIANIIYKMIAEGDFPVSGSVYLAEAAPRVGDGLVRLDVDGRITFASPNARSAFSRIGWFKDMDGHHLGEILDSLSRSESERIPREENWRVSMSGKTLRRDEFENRGGVIDLLAIPLSESKTRIGALVLVHNVTELRRRDKALVSKDATIREIHHRVKNNLQTVSALLRLQARRTTEPEATAAIHEAVRRVASIALVHETLSASSRDSVPFDDVISKIATSAVELSERPDAVQIEKVGTFGEIPSIMATPLALVITELIHNSLEHGLAEVGSKVTIEVSTSDSSDSVLKVSVRDDGAGLKEGFSLEENPNLGLQIVKTLTENELDGTLTFRKLTQGTEFMITFNAPKAS